jgi:hypothetical protein
MRSPSNARDFSREGQKVGRSEASSGAGRARALPRLLALLVLTTEGAAAAEPSRHDAKPPHVVWSGDHALTLAARRFEVGLFQSSHYGLGPAELSLHPVTFFALPHLELKASTGYVGPSCATALRVRLSYPTPFLGLVSREGAGGLLPKTSAPPQALQLEADFMATFALGPPIDTGLGHWVTASLGAAAAAHGGFSPSELPLLDFPFLYQRFAPLYTAAVPRFTLGLQGPVWGRLYYEAGARYFLMPDLPDVGTASALEPSVRLEYRFSDHVATSLDLEGSLAKYAHGTRLHVLPYADVRFGF